MNTQEAIGILNYMLRDIENDAPNSRNSIEGEALTHAIEYMRRSAPEGWQLVPKEPTYDIIDEGVDVCWDKFTWTENVDNSDLKDLCKRFYKAMLSVAPEPPQERK